MPAMISRRDHMTAILSRLMLVAVAALSCLGFTDCTRNEFTVEFELPADVSSTYTLLYYASDPARGWLMEDVANVVKGQGEIKVPSVNPTLVYVFKAGNRVPQATFYAERGDRIRIVGKSGLPGEWSITGNDLTEALSEWRLANSGVIADSQKPGDAGKSKLNRKVSEYVAAHPEDPVSAILLLEYFDRRSDEAGFRKSWTSLRGAAAEVKWKELVSRSDMTVDESPHDRLPERITLNTVATGCDTIIPGRVPILLYFARNSVSTHKNDKSVLRALVREFPDSGTRVIADISFETDSMARLYPIRTDSLHKVVRGWMPLGVSDTLAAGMGVGRLPYLIVADRKGRVVYRGGNAEDAAARFRETMK